MIFDLHCGCLIGISRIFCCRIGSFASRRHEEDLYTTCCCETCEPAYIYLWGLAAFGSRWLNRFRFLHRAAQRTRTSGFSKSGRKL